MTPVLIRIEQLLDEIRVCTRAIVANTNQQPITIGSMEMEDFRVKLESADIVDYDSETETEDDATSDDHNDENPITVGGKRSREVEDEDEEKQPQRKRVETRSVASPMEKLKENVQDFAQAVNESKTFDGQVDSKELDQVMARLKRCCSSTMSKMMVFARRGEISVDIATQFRDTTLLLPAVFAQYQEHQAMTPKWVKGLAKTLGHVITAAKGTSDQPLVFLDPNLETIRRTLSEQWKDPGPDFLRKMELLIDRVTAKGELHPDRIEKSLGKLASFLRNDFKTYTGRKKEFPRSEEDWERFAEIGKVLTEWIHMAESVTTPPTLRAPLARFHTQLNGFAKRYSGRVPTSLLEAAKVLEKFAQPPNSSKEAPPESQVHEP